MAITHYSISDCEVYLVEQATWGTAGADDANGIIIPCEPPHIEFDDKEVEITKALTVRTMDKQSYYTHQKGVNPKVTLTGFALENLIPRFLYGYFQSVTEGATTPFDKTFVPHATQPDFTANAGYFFTLIMYNGAASTAYKMSDCIVQHINFSSNPGEMSKYTVDIIGRKIVAATSNPTGTYSHLAQEYFHFEDQARHYYNNGSGAYTPVLLGGWELDLTQEVRPIGQDGSGNNSSFAVSNKTGTFKSKVLVDTNTRGLLTNRGSNTMVSFNIAWGGGTAGETDGDLDFSFQGKVTPATARNEEPDLGIDLEVKLLSDVENSEEMIEVVAADATDMSW